MNSNTFTYKKYDSYKDSEVEWIGDIPEDWEVTKNKRIFKHRDRIFNMEEETPVLSLTTTGVKIKKNLDTGKSAESYIGHQIAKPGEIVFSPRDYDQTPILSGVVHNRGCISNLYFVLSPKQEILVDFINYYWWGLKYGRDYFRKMSYGMRYSFNTTQFGWIPFLKPSLEMQQNIVNFLDQKTSQIDTLIKKKKKLIKFLKEKRQVLITQAVTKGLDPKVKMKDSGVEWIGEIPEGWSLKKLKYTFTIQDTRLKHDPSVNILLSVSGYRGVVPKDLEGFEGQMPSEDVSEYRIVKKGQLVVNTMWLNHTGLGVSDYEGYVSPAYRAYTLGKELQSHYVHHLLRSLLYVQKYSSLLYGVRPNSLQVKPYDFDRIEVLHPSKTEQKSIAEFLDKKTEQIDLVAEKTELQIEKLQEFKSALIYNVVTGKIKA